MDVINYIKKLLSGHDTEPPVPTLTPRKRRAELDNEFSSITEKKFKLTPNLGSPCYERERVERLAPFNFRGRIINNYRMPHYSPSISKPKPTRNWSNLKESIEISDDEEDIYVIEDGEAHTRSFYKRDRSSWAINNSPSIQINGANEDDDDDDDDVKYVTCVESNESRAKRLGYKYFKSSFGNSPLARNSFSLQKKSPGIFHRPVSRPNRVSKPSPPKFSRFALGESVRLDEKEKYQELLRQTRIGSKSFEPRDPSSSFEHSPRFLSLNASDNRSRSRKMLDSILTPTEVKQPSAYVDLTDPFADDFPSPKSSPFFNFFKSKINHNSSPVINNISATNGDSKKLKSPLATSDLSLKDLPTCDISSKSSDSEVEVIGSPTPSTNTDTDSVLSAAHLKAVIHSKPVCSPKWIKELKQKHDSSIREKQIEIDEAKLRRERHSEQNRKLFGASLEDRIRRSLIISDPIEIIEDSPEGEPFPELTSEQEQLINRALSSGSSHQVVSQKFNMNITRRDIQTLAGLNWLNDEIINFYMNLIMERSNQEGKPKVYATNTFFYPKLMQGGHQSLKRWTKKVDIFAHDIMLIPVHLGVHWCMALIDFRSKHIRYYDSMGSHNPQCSEALLQYLADERMDKKKEKFDKTGWAMPRAKDIPQQMNGSDCGMFSCTFAEFYTRNAEFTFSQEDMPYLRRKMVLEIILGKLLMN